MKKHLQFRSWFYFRIGYGQYFTFLLGLANMCTLTYYLAIDNNDVLNGIFSNFTTYVITVVAISVPLFSMVGFLHMRKIAAYKAEAEVSAESQPYHYKLNPGISKECTTPLLLETLIVLQKTASGKSLDDDDVARLKDLEKKFEVLVSGGSLPRPARFDVIK